MRDINKKISITPTSPRDICRVCQSQDLACQKLSETTVLKKKVQKNQRGKRNFLGFRSFWWDFAPLVPRLHLYIDDVEECLGLIGNIKSPHLNISPSTNFSDSERQYLEIQYAFVRNWWCVKNTILSWEHSLPFFLLFSLRWLPAKGMFRIWEAKAKTI